jgi:RNA polymerase sigma factor (sigma-70 family)
MRRPWEGAELGEIEAVYRQRLGELRRVATAITGSRDAGVDAVQEGFARAIRQRHGFRREGSIEAWLWRIVVNAARTSAAADRPAALDERGDTTAIAEPAGLHALVGELPERQRLALFLRYYADLDYATIAEALGVTTGTVGATLSQARDSLRRVLEEVRS